MKFFFKTFSFVCTFLPTTGDRAAVLISIFLKTQAEFYSTFTVRVENGRMMSEVNAKIR